MKRWLARYALPRGRHRRVVHLSPPATLALGFVGLIAIGAALLKLPVSTVHPIGWLDAAFTATSAVTVTGLVVVDTAATFTRFGETVIALLIQLGGLGLMTFAVLVLSALGQRLGLRHQLLLRDDLNQTSLGDLAGLVRIILAQVLIFEVLGMVLLALRWVPAQGWTDGLFNAFFHAISAFNNAGFALFPNSLSQWLGDPVVNLVIPGLYIAGGLGFAVIHELRSRRSLRHLSLHTKLMLAGTLALNLWAFCAFLGLEWSNPGTLGGLHNLGDKLWAAWFQATTTRTAGFNTLDFSQVRDGTALMTISLMFIGGGSTSTAGGIKVTTFMVLVFATVAFLRRRETPVAFGRSIGAPDVLKVLALTFVSLLTVMIGTFLLAVSQGLPFLDVAFESASAFATVGLSRGVTGELNAFGQVVLMVLMFAGRVGPLSLGFLLATPARRLLRYPQQHVYLG